MRKTMRYVHLAVVMVLLTGCVSVYYPDESSGGVSKAGHDVQAIAYKKKVAALAQRLAALGANTDGAESVRLAETAVRSSAVLAEDYRLIRPPLLHNIFVRIGLKDRGLCYQWTEDLLQRLNRLALKTYRLHWAVAYRGSDLREHNCVVVTAAGQPFQSGIVLDPWRHSGDLYWVLVKRDTYPWQELPPAAW